MNRSLGVRATIGGCRASPSLGPTDVEVFPAGKDSIILSRLATEGNEPRKVESERQAKHTPPDAVQSEKTSSRNPCISVQDRASALAS